MDWNLPKAHYIDDSAVLTELVETLSSEPMLAVDTESNSLYAYRERVCLIQLSTRTADYIVDPLRCDVQPLGALFANPATEKVFHAAEYDLICLKRDYGFTFTNLFDTMLAARICGYRHIGLGNLLYDHLGIEVDKSHQRDDWGKRPLPDDSLLYAQMDTHYLAYLRDRLQEELLTMERIAEAKETFAELCHVMPGSNGFDPDGFWRIGLPNQLNLRQMAILRRLYLLRESIAEQRDCPPFKVFTDKTLVALAQTAPQRISDLFGINGMTPAQIRRYGRQLTQAVEKGEKDKLPTQPPRQPVLDPEAVELYTALREWRKERARLRGVESDVIISKDALWELARAMPDSLEKMQEIVGLGPWRVAAYGEEILTVIERYKQ